MKKMSETQQRDKGVYVIMFVYVNVRGRLCAQYVCVCVIANRKGN